MTEFECAVCRVNVVAIVADRPPADSLCMECRVIAQAAPEDRAALARIFKKPVPAAA